MKTLFVTIGTSKYINFVKNLCSSMQDFCNLENFDVMVCTDQDINFSFSKFKIIKHEVTHQKHPHGTLYRYHFYLEKIQLLQQYDYIFHIDADMELVDSIGSEILSERVCVIHPGFHFTSESKFFDLESRIESKAYFDVKKYPSAKYYQNCLQGGSKNEFIKMSETIKQWTDSDVQNGIIAKWHDESYMNKYMLENKPSLELDCSYAYPEKWNIAFKKKILHLDKDHVAIRS